MTSITPKPRSQASAARARFKRIGSATRSESVLVQPLTVRLVVGRLLIYNPPGFDEPPFLSLIDVNPQSML